MKKRKLELYITGKLMSALMVGRPAIFSTGGEMYHTAPVVKIHETETQEIHFETLSNNPTTIFVLWRNLWRGCRIIHDQWHTLLFRHSHMARISYNRFPIVCRGQTIYPCCSRNFLATKLFY